MKETADNTIVTDKKIIDISFRFIKCTSDWPKVRKVKLNTV